MAFPIRVQATELGYYDGRRIRLGEVFTIKSDKELSARWMRKLKPGERPLLPEELVNEVIGEDLSEAQAPASEDPPTGPARPAASVKPAAGKPQPKQAGTGSASVL